MKKRLVIVESPTKAKTIGKFLGPEYEVLASFGHIRDLPQSAAEIPADIKKQAWTRVGINVDEDFAPLYIIPEDKKSRVNDLKKSLKDASELYLATDEDREGESISWHLLEVLKPKVPFKRMVFHEITKSAIQDSINHARDVDLSLVRAQETRRIIDRLYGYTVSPLLWKKVAPRLSAGRVQSVAMRLLAERERSRISFKKAQYWDLGANFSKESEKVESDLFSVGGKSVAQGKDFDENTGKLAKKSNAVVIDEKQAAALKEKLEKAGQATVTSVEEKPYTTRPYPPFTTSTLQQEASRKLGYAARRTMQIAQKLYENGLITYMRTDSTTLSSEALTAARDMIGKEYGAPYLPSEPRFYQTKVKNAQEAHEAIRPAGSSFVHPSDVKIHGDEAFKMYDLIWKRTIASQMNDAKGLRVSVDLTVDDMLFRANGRTILFAGYLRAYVEGSDDPESDLQDREKILPKLAVNDVVKLLETETRPHETQPPARFTEGSLIKELERLGIGRPSTWATIVDVVLSRDYAFKRGQALVPTFLAMVLTNLMETYFTEMVDYAYTARLEDDLDAISRGEAKHIDYLKKFFLGNGSPGLKDLVAQGQENIDPRIVCGLALGEDAAGTPVEIRIGRYGPFITDGTNRASVPPEIGPDEMTIERALGILEIAKKGPESVGNDPVTGLPIYIKTGRFGPYVQLGDRTEEQPKPKMASLLKGMAATEVTLEVALKLLSLPREVGINPENNEKIIAAAGRFGPYIKCGTDTRSLPAEMTPIDVTLEQAIELLKQPRAARGAKRAAKKIIRELGNHPDSGKPIQLLDGQYGPYVSDGKVNATVPKDNDLDGVTLLQALDLLAARSGKKKTKRGASSKASAPASKEKAAPKKAKATKKKTKASEE